MNISVVIPALNEEQLIGETILAVLSQTVPVRQILLVDGGSTDATVTVASAFTSVEVIRSAPPVGRQRQAGLERAVGDLVFFLDADTLPDRDFVSECIREMERRKLRIACPWYKPVPSSPGIGLVYFVFNVLFAALQRFLPSGAGSGIVVDRRLALEAGGFRDDLVYEDIEFIRRAARKGRFGTLKARLGVSDRRFRRFGVIRTLGKYLALSFFFTFGLFKQAGVVSYPFADYAEEEPELVVLVDGQNNQLGTAPKSGVHGPDTPLHRAFSVFLFNERGEVLLQQRSAAKITWPSVWSNSCCGHPGPGESVESAARRRIREELGVDVHRLWNVLPEYRYRAESKGIVENEICPVLVGIAANDPQPDPAEVADVRWISWDELLSSVGPNSELTPWCVEEVRLLEASSVFHDILSQYLDARDNS